MHYSAFRSSEIISFTLNLPVLRWQTVCVLNLSLFFLASSPSLRPLPDGTAVFQVLGCSGGDWAGDIPYMDDHTNRDFCVMLSDSCHMIVSKEYQ